MLTRPDPTRQNLAKSWPDPTRPDPTRGSIRPVDNSVADPAGQSMVKIIWTRTIQLTSQTVLCHRVRFQILGMHNRTIPLLVLQQGILDDWRILLILADYLVQKYLACCLMRAAYGINYLIFICCCLLNGILWYSYASLGWAVIYPMLCCLII